MSSISNREINVLLNCMNKVNKSISGFSKLSKEEKIDWITSTFISDNPEAKTQLKNYWLENEKEQKVFDAFSENTLSNFHLPYGVAPNFLIDGRYYAVPMVIEESSVVAAASSAAKYWSQRGGIHTEIVDTQKIGQVHFTWSGDPEVLTSTFAKAKIKLEQDAEEITLNMRKRGGGILNIELINLTDQLDHLYQLKATFETCDSMGANFINTCLEQFAHTLSCFYSDNYSDEGSLTIIMSILSNYTDNCVVKAWVECPISDLEISGDNLDHKEAAAKFKTAVDIACIDPYRAVTHNKGIFNGIDAVVLATGNDFRAVEASGHAYASRSGQYASLSKCTMTNEMFRFELEIPLALGTVGGLTKLHPLAKLSLDILGQPSARELMSIIAATGLAQNFAAVRSLTTTGIQKGHMKMHLQNILNQLEASDDENKHVCSQINGDQVSYSKVRQLIEDYRGVG